MKKDKLTLLLMSNSPEDYELLNEKIRNKKKGDRGSDMKLFKYIKEFHKIKNYCHQPQS